MHSSATWLRQVVTALCDLVLPPVCAGCGGHDLPHGVAFCPACAPSSMAPSRPCPRCGRPLGAPLCPTCRRTPPLVASPAAPLLYGGEVARAIRRLKYHRATHLAWPLGRLMQPTMLGFARRLDAVVPVPLHRRRLRSRGFNQAALLARAAIRSTPLVLRHDLLMRARDTRAQTELDPRERWINVAGAFVASAAVQGQRLLLIDDVTTTGATATACASALLQAGATETHLLTLARAMP